MLEVALVLVEIAALGIGPGVLWIEPDGFTEVREGVIEIGFDQVGIAAIDVGGGRNGCRPLMASLQSDKARSGSFLANHHPQRLPNATARLAAVSLGSLMTRSHAAMLSSALLTSPTNLQRSRSL
ncbi:MAG: hypothetical protein WDN50_20720 [Bradyrhizobium sp.]